MYLTRLVLQNTHPKTLRLLADVYELHRALMTSLSPTASATGERLLFRLEPEQRDSDTVVLVQTTEEPNWSKFAAAFAVRSVETKLLDIQVQEGVRIRFRLRACPTASRRQAKDAPTKRVPLTTEEEQRLWLERKLSEAGLEVAGFLLIKEPKLVLRKKGNANTMTFNSVRFEGTAHVVAPSELLAHIRQGVGTGKAFGFGLLSIGRGS